MKSTPTQIEALENRIAPAGLGLGAVRDGLDPATLLNPSISLDGHVATFTDFDGDTVTVKLSKGALVVEDFLLIKEGLGARFQSLDLSLAGFSKSDLTITSKRGPGGGDGMVNVGEIGAIGIDLGSVSLGGDLGRIVVGDSDLKTPALRSLKVFSLGQTQSHFNLLAESHFTGSLVKLVVLGSIEDAVISVEGSDSVNLGSALIGDSVRGSELRSEGHIGSIKLVGGMEPSAGHAHSVISAGGLETPLKQSDSVAIGNVTIGGSVRASQILAGCRLGSTQVNGDASIGSVSVRGAWLASDLVAGVASSSGRFDAGGSIRTGNANIVSKIARLTVRSGMFGGTEAPDDGFGIVAEQIDALKIGQTTIPLLKGAANDTTGVIFGLGKDLVVREMAPVVTGS